MVVPRTRAFEHEAYDILAHLAVQCSRRLVGDEDPRLRGTSRSQSRSAEPSRPRPRAGNSCSTRSGSAICMSFEQRDLRFVGVRSCLPRAARELQLASDSHGRVERADRVLRATWAAHLEVSPDRTASADHFGPVRRAQCPGRSCHPRLQAARRATRESTCQILTRRRWPATRPSSTSRSTPSRLLERWSRHRRCRGRDR